jgi:hypothetical protein
MRTHKAAKPFTEALYAPPLVGATAESDPKATAELPLNESSGRFVIVCFEESSADTRTSSSAFTPPSAVYAVPTEIDIGSEH